MESDPKKLKPILEKRNKKKKGNKEKWQLVTLAIVAAISIICVLHRVTTNEYGRIG